MFVARNEERATTTRATLLVAHADVWNVHDIESGFANTPAEIEIFTMQEVILIETTNRIEYGARQEQTGAGYGIDKLGALSE